MGRLIATLALLMVLTPPVAVSAADGLGVSIGLSGHFRLGAWTPVRVTGLDDGPVRIRCSDPTGLLVDYPLSEVDGDFVGAVQFANPQSRAMVFVGDAKKAVAAFVPGQLGVAHQLSERLWLAPDGGFDLAAERFNETAEDKDRAVSIAGDTTITWPDDLQLDAYAVANVIALTQRPDDRSLELLRDWVSRGGHLLVCGGLEESGLPEWCGIDVEGQANFRDLNALETAVPAGRGLRVEGTISGSKLVVRDGRTIVDSSFGPILARSSYGLGFVSVFAIDLLRPELQRWPSLDSLCLLLANESPGIASNRRRNNRLTTSGVSEFQTQLLAAVDASEGQGRTRPDQWSILGRLIVYAIAVGFVDYLLVHYLLRRPQLTWFTMPLWAIGVFAVVAFEAESSGSSTARTSVQTLSVIDHETVSGTVRATALNSVASLDRKRIDASLSDAAIGEAADTLLPVEAARIGWLAAPETTFGGLYRDATVASSALAYRATESRSGFAGVPIEPRGSRLFATTWSSKQSSRLLQVNLSLSGTRPQGTITHSFPAAITDWAFAVGRNFVRPRQPTPLEPGEPFEVSAETCTIQSLRDVMIGLKRLEVIEGKNGNRPRTEAERTDYDPTSLVHSDALLTATFFSKAGGLGYTGIRDSGSPNGLDLSKHLDYDRIVFIGVMDTAVRAIELADGTKVPEDDAATYVRVVSPLSDSSTTESKTVHADDQNPTTRDRLTSLNK